MKTLQTPTAGKHSPSPWMLTQSGIIHEPNSTYAEIAIIPGEEWTDKSLANAKLIAAAPDLYAAADNVLKLNGGPICGRNTDDGEEYVMVRRQDFDELARAHKKAEGEP